MKWFSKLFAEKEPKDEWNIVVPPAKENEPNCTIKQINFIHDLFAQLEKDDPFHDLEEGGMGKWQASALIDQLIELRDEGPHGKEFDRALKQANKDFGIEK